MKPDNYSIVLIGGGAGYIGFHANKILNKRGFGTVVYGKLSSGHRVLAKWGHFVLGDFFSGGHLLSLEYLQSGAPSGALNLGNGNGFSVKVVIH